MNCSSCSCAYVLVGDEETGFARSLCPCEADERCPRCKRGHLQPVNQATIDSEMELTGFACADHGHSEAEFFKPPKPAAPSMVIEEAAWVKNRKQNEARHAKSVRKVYCLECKGTHVESTRNVVWYPETNVGTSLCPGCKAPGPYRYVER